MPDKLSVQGFIRPLSWLEVDAIAPGETPRLPTLEGLLLFLSATRGIDLEKFVEAYRQVSQQDQLTPLFIVPNEPRLIERLVQPLRDAKASYVLGNYLGTIALAGMIGEMVALLLNEIRVHEKNLAPEEINRFEKLRQQERVAQLRLHGAIEDQHVTAFSRIRETRRRYLHAFTQSHQSIRLDAGNAFHAAQALVTLTVYDGFLEGGLRMNPAFARYLERRGVVNREQTTPPPEGQPPT